MSNVHVCSLPHKDTSGLPRLAPNASFCKRLARKLRKLIIVDPNSFKCHQFSYNKSVIMSEQRRHIASPYRYMIHPFSILSTVQEVLFFLIWTCRMLMEPIVDVMVDWNIFTTFAVIDIILHCMQLMLTASLFFVGYVDQKTKEVVIERKRVICKYLKTYFIFDFVATEVFSTLKVWNLMKYITNSYLVTWYSRHILACIHVPCLYVRLNTSLNYLDDIGRLMKLGKKTRTIIVHALRTYMYLHVLSGMLYYVPRVVYWKKFPENSWISVAKIVPGTGAAPGKIYSECMLMTICCFFGAEQKYMVHQTVEHVCLSIVAFSGRLYTLFVIADILRAFGIVGLSQSNYERELSQAMEYMRTYDFPLTMRSRMIRYFEYKFQKRFFDEMELINNLSGELRTQIFLFFASPIIEKCNVFQYVPHMEIANVFSGMKLETFTPGDTIYKTGQIVRHLYFISSGTVAVINKNGIELCHLEDGDVFGMCTVLFGKEVHSVLVLEPTDVMVIETDAFFQLLEAYPHAVKYLYKMARDRNAMFKQQERFFKREKGGCLDDIKHGKLLEKRRERATF